MNDSYQTRAGGDRSDNPRKTLGFSRVETAGAPAFGVETENATPPEWIQLVPPGSFHGRDGRGPYVLADPAAVIAATMALGMRAGIPIDYDHATDFGAPQGTPAPAAGWITELAIRNGAIWGRVEWTARAAGAIQAHEYRYISPVFQYSPSDGTITRLLRAGLTNNPNLYLTAISAVGDEESNMDEFVKQLREMLGLSGEASTDEILKAIAVTTAAAATGEHDGSRAQRNEGFDPARHVAVAEFQQALTEINALKIQRVRDKAEHAVDEAIRSGKLVPAHREWAISYCAADPTGFESFATRQPVVLAGELNLGGNPKMALSRSHTGSRLSGTEVAICGLLGVSPGDFLKRKDSGADFLQLNKDLTGPSL
jgi:phage I-like protein